MIGRIEQLYPNWRGRWATIPDWTPLISSYGMAIAVLSKVSDSYYSGGHRLVLLEGKQRYGLLCYYSGCCPMCDLLWRCDTLADIADLHYDIYRRIVFYPRLEMIAALESGIAARLPELEKTSVQIKTDRFRGRATDYLRTV